MNHSNFVSRFDPYPHIHRVEIMKSFSRAQEKPEEDTVLLENTRLLRRDELTMVRSGSLPRLPDCFQNKPKKAELYTIICIMKMLLGVPYIVSNLSSPATLKKK